MTRKPRILMLTGYGLNCEDESSRAWELAGAEVIRQHLQDAMEDPSGLRDVQGLMFIGGFSFGDHMTSGHVFAHRVRHHLGDELRTFRDRGGIVLGVCNGFKILTKLGLLPGFEPELKPAISLMQNDCGRFQNYWVTLGFDPKSPCIFTRGLDRLDLPIRHGEGKVFTPDKALFERIRQQGCIPCRYLDDRGQSARKPPANPNGSLDAAAGLCDPSGRVFGLMPHPEAYLFPENHPQWDRQKTQGTLPETGGGLALFKNAVDYLRAA